jgi:hypothetical protein
MPGSRNTPRHAHHFAASSPGPAASAPDAPAPGSLRGELACVRSRLNGCHELANELERRLSMNPAPIAPPADKAGPTLASCGLADEATGVASDLLILLDQLERIVAAL